MATKHKGTDFTEKMILEKLVIVNIESGFSKFMVNGEMALPGKVKFEYDQKIKVLTIKDFADFTLDMNELTKSKPMIIEWYKV